MSRKAGGRNRKGLGLAGKVKKTIEKHGLLKKGDKVLVACSGGADSTALLDILLTLRRDFSVQLALAHFNHKLRRNADKDEEFVHGLARTHGLPLYVKRESIRAYAREHGLNIEEAGRTRRYEFLKAVAAKISASRIATGHTMTDQAETFLLRLLRGSGPQGLAGIAPAIDGLIIRPLLEVERGEIEKYLKARGLSCRTDESNFDRRYLRNRIRLDLIPFLERKFEPQIVPHLSQLAAIIREEDDWLESLAEERARQALRSRNGRTLLDARVLSSFPPGLARRVVRIFLGRAKGDLRRITFKDIESIRSLADQKEIHLPGRLTLRREKDEIFLEPPLRPPVRYEYVWDGEKNLAVQELNLQFSGTRKSGWKKRNLRFDNERRAYLDAAKLRFPLLVRNRRAGDRYQPLGAPGRKKLKEIMRARGIPVSERERQPVFLSGDRIVWVLGLPVAEAFKVTSRTKEIFIIEIISSSEKGKG
jgi:tRNA(Ile)-lysidine synthase